VVSCWWTPYEHIERERGAAQLSSEMCELVLLQTGHAFYVVDMDSAVSLNED